MGVLSIFIKCDIDVLKLLLFDQLRYMMLHYVTFATCYATFCSSIIPRCVAADKSWWVNGDAGVGV